MDATLINGIAQLREVINAAKALERDANIILEVVVKKGEIEGAFIQTKPAKQDNDQQN